MIRLFVVWWFSSQLKLAKSSCNGSPGLAPHACPILRRCYNEICLLVNIWSGSWGLWIDTHHPRFVKWPKYIRLQRQKVVLQTRLKVSLKTSDNVIAYKAEWWPTQLSWNSNDEKFVPKPLTLYVITFLCIGLFHIMVSILLPQVPPAVNQFYSTLDRQTGTDPYFLAAISPHRPWQLKRNIAISLYRPWRLSCYQPLQAMTAEFSSHQPLQAMTAESLAISPNRPWQPRIKSYKP